MAALQPPGVTRSRLSNILAAESYSFPAASRPGPTDDTTKGYVVGSVWRAPDGALWTARRVTAGAAMWQKSVAVVPLAGDTTSGLVAAYGLRRLVAAYTGNAIDVVRASDSTSKSVGFLSNGGLDVATLYGFIQGTTGAVSKWYDQSGGGFDAAQATAANQPTITPFNYIGNSPGVFFDNGITTNFTATPQQYLTIPAGLTGLSSASVSAVALVCLHGAARISPIVELSANTGAGATLPVAWGNSIQGGIDALAVNYSSYATTRTLTGVRPPMTPIVTGYSSGASMVLWCDDRDTHSGTAIANTQLQGGFLGTSTKFLNGSAVQQYGYQVQAAVLIYNKALTAAQQQAAAASLYADFGLAPQAHDIWIADGDSITEGAYSTYFQGWPRQAIPLINWSARAYNAGTSGGTFTTQLAAQGKWTPLLSLPGVARRIVSCAIGSNDLVASATAAAIYANFLTWRSNVLTASATALIVPCTLIPRYNLTTAQEAERLAYNALLRTNWRALGCPFIIDFAADSTMGSAAVANSVSYDSTLLQDGTHPTPLGYAYMAQIAASAFNAYLAPT